MTELRDEFPGFDAFKIAFDSQSLALFLDVDGTLLHIAARPDAVRVTPPLREMLDSLHASNAGALALVSGRRLADIDQLFAPLHLPAAGLHGLERRDSHGIIHALDRSTDLDEVRRFLSEHSYSDVLIEDKGSALVLHYREAPEREEHCRDLAMAAARRMRGGWQVVPGKMSFEIRVTGVGKQDAIESFLAEPPFLGRRAVFLGDDVTDEEGFELVNHLGGWSIHIGVSEHTSARYRLPDPASVMRFLGALQQPAVRA